MSFWIFITLVLNPVKISCISTYVVVLPIQSLLILIQPIYGIRRSKRRIEVFPVTVWFQVLGRNSKGGKSQGSVSRSLRMAESMAISGWLPYSFFFLHNHINLPFLYAYCWYTYVVVVFSTDQVEPWSRKEQLGRSSAWWLRRQQRCSVWSPWRVCPRSGLNQSLLWRLGRSKGRFGGISFQWEDFESD